MADFAFERPDAISSLQLPVAAAGERVVTALPLSSLARDPESLHMATDPVLNKRHGSNGCRLSDVDSDEAET